MPFSRSVYYETFGVEFLLPSFLLKGVTYYILLLNMRFSHLITTSLLLRAISASPVPLLSRKGTSTNTSDSSTSQTPVKDHLEFFKSLDPSLIQQALCQHSDVPSAIIDHFQKALDIILLVLQDPQPTIDRILALNGTCSVLFNTLKSYQFELFSIIRSRFLNNRES